MQLIDLFNFNKSTNSYEQKGLIMKKILYAAAFTVAIIYSPALAGGILRDAKAPHIVHSGAHPNNARMSQATHHFDVHVQGSDLEQLFIDIPEGIKVRNRITITERSNKKVDAKVSINNKRVTIAFTQPVPKGTTLLVSMKGVSANSLQGRTWLYPVYSRSVGIKAEVPIGIAQIQTY